jgi:hypothetical protein
MTTTLTSCSENTMVLSEGEGFCMHVFSSTYITICIQALSVKRNNDLFPVLRTWVCPMKTVRLTGQTCTFDISKQHFAGRKA